MITRTDVCGDVVGTLSSAILGSAGGWEEDGTIDGMGEGDGDDECCSSSTNGMDVDAVGGTENARIGHVRRGRDDAAAPSSSTGANEDRRLACWTLGNLATPIENKVRMLSTSTDDAGRGGG